ncbi:MAG TPA: hypothetical protein VNO70_24485, partial [Blastocatellia bacterium]|nr:hypothetical protein [Blastocatellia bacterium]
MAAMNKKARIVFSLLVLLTPALGVRAQDAGLTLRPIFRPGQETRYVITALVETAVTPEGANGIAGNIRRELTATVLLRTLEVSEKGEVSQEAVIEKVEVAGGQPVDALAGRKVEMRLSGGNGLLKITMPQEAADLGLAELISSLRGWFPTGDVAVGQTWRATGQGPVFAEGISEIGKVATTVYNLSSVNGNVASINGDI